MKGKTLGKRLAVFGAATLMCCSFVLPIFASCSCGGETSTAYTYNEYIARFPSSWSTHNASSDADLYVQKYSEIGLYAYTLNADRTSFAFVDEMATGDPVNVTANYQDKFGITDKDAANDKAGKAWEITLNPDATWENGEKITADDYVWSMERVLSPDMKNKLATTYISGEKEIFNAQKYYKAGFEYVLLLKDETKTEEDIMALIDEGKIYFSLTSSNIVLGKFTLQYYHDLMARNARFFRKDKSEDPNVRDWYAYLTEQYGKDANEFGYIQVTKDNYQDIKEGMTVLSENIGKKNLPNWYNTLSIPETHEDEKVELKDVGIFKTGDMKFVMVFKNALSLYQVKNALTSNWLVYKPAYEEGYKTQGSLTLTNYGTTSGKYVGYGPYKLEKYETDKQITLVRNDKWYGYNKDACNYHKDEYQADRIVCHIIGNQATALLEFERGGIDSVVLSANDMDKYKFSDYLLKRTASNTWSISFNSDVSKLEAIEADGNGNRRILSVYEFRKALSLCLDRTYIGQNIMVGSAPAFSFINDNYYYDMENNPTSIYRNTDQAKKAIVKLYGIEYGEDKTYKTLDEAYKSIAGYDLDVAKKNFSAAYDKAVEQGIYKEGDKICINIYNSSTSAKYTALINYIQSKVNEATAGTKLENKITVSGQVGNNLGAAINGGTIEARYYSFAGEYANPNGMIGNFTNSRVNLIPECGFNPTTETITITADFDGNGEPEEITKPYHDWQQSIAAGGAYATAKEDVKLEIMSQLEYNLLNGFRTLPLCVGTDLTLRSKKVYYATEKANIFVAYGGIRLMKFKYNDGEWAKFCKNADNLKYN